MNFLIKVHLILLLIVFTNGYKIGIFVPSTAISQIIFTQRVGDILSDAGHNVTFINIQTFKFKENIKLTAKPGSKVWNIDATSNLIDYEKLWNEYSDYAFADESLFDLLTKPRPCANNMTWIMKAACAGIVSNKELMKNLKDLKFDVVFAHMIDFCPIGIQYAIQAPTWIWFSSGPLLDHMATLAGLSLPASYAPPVVADMSDTLSFYERAKSIIGHTVTQHAVKGMFADDQTEIFRHFIDPKFPHLFDIAKTAPLIFVNSNELYDLPRPTLNKIINIGGIQKLSAEPKPLSALYRAKIKAAKNVVIFTFGSIANPTRMPKAWKSAFMNAFEKFNDTQFFVRYDGNDLNPPKNVYLNKWLPQSELLQHPKTAAFITHGGYNGIHEALLAAKPLIVIPLFGDQFKNARIAEKHGFGIILRKADICEENIVKALESLFTNDKYAQAAKAMNAMIKKQPIPPETLLIRWTEFVAEFKTLDNLKPIGASLDIVTFYNIDVYATMVTVAFVVLFIFYKIIVFVVRKIAHVFRSFWKIKAE